MTNNSGINLSGLAFKTDNNWVLRNLSLNFHVNKSTMLSGPSGCGKTTLLRLIAGLEQPDEGEIAFAKQIWSTANELLPPWQRDLDMLFQNDALWPNLRIGEQIEWVRKHRKKTSYKFEIKELFSKLGIEDLIERFPAGLSGGEARRCQLARVIAGEPSVLLLDEPLAAQDEATAGKTASALKTWLAEMTTTAIIATHEMKHFKECDWHHVLLPEKNQI